MVHSSETKPRADVGGTRGAMNLRAIAIASACLALNLVLGKTAAVLSLPVYLDSVGTILAAALLPPRYALAAAALTSFVGGLLIHPAFPFYLGTQLVICALAIAAVRRRLFGRWWTAALVGLAIGLCAAVVSAPVTVIVFGGVTLSGATAINAVLMAAGQRIWQAVIAGSTLVEAIDKPSAAILAWLALRRLPARLVPRSPASE